MIRKIIKIDEDKCNGCGACATACHEGAIDIIDGKAKLVREHYCDGLGDCLPACPTGAITFEEREAPAYDEEAVLEAKKRAGEKKTFTGCPGTRARMMAQRDTVSESVSEPHKVPSRLMQWPVQIKLLPTVAPFYENANLLVAADCSAFTYGNFHEDFIKNKVTMIGCPKLDAVDYYEKLLEIIRNNNIKSVTIVRMEVPCCGGLENAVKRALQDSGKFLPWQVVVISVQGEVLE
ncbi:MAG: 4Fe-4S binding protein [Lachnospiraceae bacterium]|nr:4Fe-4S binding protein [Lachnospiraceae bacterium]